MHTTPARRRFATVALTAGSALLAFGALAPQAQAEDDTGPTAYPDNPKCADVDSSLIQFKIDTQPTNGSYTASTEKVEILPEDADLPDGFTIVISNVDTSGDNVTFDWAAFVADGDDAGTDPDPFPIDMVQVKAGPGGNRYTYASPGATSDTGLVSPKDSISHVDFCFDGPGGSDTGGTDATTTDGTTTDGTTTDGTTTDGTTTDGTTTDGTTTDGTTADAGTTDGTTVGSSDTETTDGPTSTDDTDTEVAGEVIRPTLPRTGSEDRSMAMIGAALVLLGGASLVLRREVFIRS